MTDSSGAGAGGTASCSSVEPLSRALLSTHNCNYSCGSGASVMSEECPSSVRGKPLQTPALAAWPLLTVSLLRFLRMRGCGEVGPQQDGWGAPQQTAWSFYESFGGAALARSSSCSSRKRCRSCLFGLSSKSKSFKHRASDQ